MSLDDVMVGFVELVVEAQGRADPVLLSEAAAQGQQLLSRPELPGYAAMVVTANVCVLLTSLFKVTGDPATIDAAVARGRQALAASTDVSALTPRYASNLASSLLARYRNSHRAEDLDEGVALCESAVLATPQADPTWSIRAQNLAAALGDRYEAQGDRADIDRSVALFEMVTARTPDTDGRAPQRLTNLARVLRIRSRAPAAQEAAREDIRRAVEVTRRVVNLQGGAPSGARLEAVLAVLVRAYELTNEVRLLDEVVALVAPALGAAATTPVSAARLRTFRAKALVYRYRATGAEADLARARAELAEPGDLSATADMEDTYRVLERELSADQLQHAGSADSYARALEDLRRALDQGAD